MSIAEQAILDRVNADNWALLYRCRWSKPDAEQVVPQLEKLLESEDSDITNEALRALFRIETPAVSTATSVATLTQSQEPMTKQLAVLALGQISHKVPALCVEALASVLTDPVCCRDAMRALAFIGPKADSALERVLQRFSDPDARIRKAAVVTAVAIDGTHPGVIELIGKASADRSKIVRDAAAQCLRKARIG